MDKSEYLRLLREAYINDTTEFRVSDPERPKARGYTTQTLPSTPPTEGEDLESIVRRILPKPIAVSVRLTGSRLAAQDPQKNIWLRDPISSPTQTYNYGLAKWLEKKLQPLANNQYTITDTCEFAYEVRELKINNGDILVSCDVTSLFANVPVDETIQILADKAFINNT